MCDLTCANVYCLLFVFCSLVFVACGAPALHFLLLYWEGPLLATGVHAPSHRLHLISLLTFWSPTPSMAIGYCITTSLSPTVPWPTTWKALPILEWGEANLLLSWAFKDTRITKLRTRQSHLHPQDWDQTGKGRKDMRHRAEQGGPRKIRREGEGRGRRDRGGGGEGGGRDVYSFIWFSF